MHIGIIPDGNRRYMRKNVISDLKESYYMGIKKFYDFVEWCIDLGVKETTVYALSIENLKNRSKFEINLLLKLFASQAMDLLKSDMIRKNKVHINICGNREYLADKINPLGSDVIKNLSKLENLTKDYSNFTLNLAIAYGGRQEIINSVNKIINDGLEVSEENIEKNLWVRTYPDIIIRTAESRLSNFLLWQSAYSEIYFVDKLWQEFEKSDLIKIVENYNLKERRFGR